MSKRTPGPEPYFTVSTKPMLAWGALLITSQLTVAAPFSNVRPTPTSSPTRC